MRLELMTKDKLPLPNRGVLIDFANDFSDNPNVLMSKDTDTKETKALDIISAWCTIEDPEMFQWAFTGWCAGKGMYFEALEAGPMHALLVLTYELLCTYHHVNRTVH